MVSNDQIAEELTSSGVASGVEFEQVEPEGGIEQPFDPEKIDVITRSMTVDLLISRVRHGAINLEPEFQRRRGIWTEQRQSRLIESLLLRIPLPTLYAAEDAEESWTIVDGIQRLTAIYRFVVPEVLGDQPLCLSGLEYLGKEFNGKQFEQLPARLQRRIKETELVVHLIRHGTPEEVMFNIFARINTGGMPLSAQELRHALIKGQVRQILKGWASSEVFLQATDHSISDERMADREMVLRFCAFRLNDFRDYRGKDFDAFLRHAMKQVNQLSGARLTQLKAEFDSALRVAAEVFGKDAFRKRYRDNASRSPVNKALFETISVNLAALSDSQREQLVQRAEGVREGFMRLVNDRDFDSAISLGTGDSAKVRLRFTRVEQMFQEVLR